MLEQQLAISPPTRAFLAIANKSLLMAVNQSVLLFTRSQSAEA